MPTITIYQKPTCTTCRTVYAALKNSGADITAVNYYLDPIPKAKVKSLLLKMGLRAKDILRTKEPIYKELNVHHSKHTEDELINLMARYPDLMQRPIVENGDKAVLARPAERVQEILSTQALPR